MVAMQETRWLRPELAATSDAALVARTRDGDGAAFELIMRRHNRRLFRLARSVLGNDLDAEEVVQDGYVIAYEKLASFRGPDGFAAWLGRIVFNQAMAVLRRRARFRSIDGTVDEAASAELERRLGDFLGERPDPEGDSARREMRHVLERSIDRLSPEFRTVFMLRVVEGLSIAETAATLGLQPETVKTRLHRARIALRRDLRAEAVTSLASVFPFAGARCDRIVANVLVRTGIGPPRQGPPGTS